MSCYPFAMPELPGSDSGVPRVVSFAGDGLHGEHLADIRLPDPAGEAARMADPGSSSETIHWGRNYIYAAEMRTDDGPVEVVVKQFRNQGWRRRLDRRLRGSKAARSWQVARELLRVGLATPRPLMWVESEAPEGPSHFVAERLAGAVEVRYFFRRLYHEPGGDDFPPVAPEAFLAALGKLARRVNDAGILYRDLSMGNILAVGGGADVEPELYLIDFNRARIGRRLGAYRRTRDICRLPIVETGHRAAFLGGYWGKTPPRWAFRWWFHAFSVRSYILKHALKKRLRAVRLHRKHAHGGSHHPHIPAAATGASARDKSVWDHLSDQPHQHASRREKWAIRLADSPSHARELAVAVSSAAAIRKRYRELAAARYGAPVRFAGIGLAVRPWIPDPEAHLRGIEELGVGPVLLRLHPWEGDHDAEERLAAALAAAGREVSFAIPQNRELVRDRQRWRAAVSELGERFSKYGRHFQVGQAINRSKWGIWTHREYVDLFLDAAEILRRHEGVEVIGPAVIDFEFQSIAALVNLPRPGLRFDIVSSLLYVDRRGAPENRQYGFDTVDKVMLLRAIAETGRNCGGRCWITEVNWPLREGPHSPAGKTVAVGEEEQADFLARYFLLTIGTGLVERVFWWRLIARGYGLIAPASDGSLRRRPAWHAMKTLIDRLEGSVFAGPHPAPDGGRLYRFIREGGEEIVVGWSVSPEIGATLPGPPVEVVGRDGNPMRHETGEDVRLGPSPVYFELGKP